MTMTKRKLSAVLIFLSTAFTGLYAESLSDFLEGWIQNDRDLKTAAISLQKSQITNEKTLIQNGFNITLSSGNMTFKTVSGVGVFTLTPNVTASIPQA